jgi:hypothetical protein
LLAKIRMNRWRELLCPSKRPHACSKVAVAASAAARRLRVIR